MQQLECPKCHHSFELHHNCPATFTLDLHLTGPPVHLSLQVRPEQHFGVRVPDFEELPRRSEMEDRAAEDKFVSQFLVDRETKFSKPHPTAVRSIALGEKFVFSSCSQYVRMWEYDLSRLIQSLRPDCGVCGGSTPAIENYGYRLVAIPSTPEEGLLIIGGEKCEVLSYSASGMKYLISNLLEGYQDVEVTVTNKENAKVIGQNHVHSLFFDADRKILLVGVTWGRILVWDVSDLTEGATPTPKQELSFSSLRGFANYVWSVSCHESLIFGGGSRSLAVFGDRNEQAELLEIGKNDAFVFSMAVGRRLYLGYNKSIRVHDLHALASLKEKRTEESHILYIPEGSSASFTEVNKVENAHSDNIWALAVTPDKRLLCSGAAGEVTLWLTADLDEAGGENAVPHRIIRASGSLGVVACCSTYLFYACSNEQGEYVIQREVLVPEH